MRSLTRTTVFTLVLLFTAGLALAQQPQQPPPGGNGAPPQAGPPNPLLRCLQIVNLSEDQKTQIKGIIEVAAPTMKALHETLVTDQKALKALFEATPQDACAIGNAILKVQTDEKAIRAELAKTKAAVEAILTTEQKIKLSGCLEAPKEGPGPAPGN